MPNELTEKEIKQIQKELSALTKSAAALKKSGVGKLAADFKKDSDKLSKENKDMPDT